MSVIQEIEAAVSKLSQDELSAIQRWFAEFDAEAWDRQFEDVVQAGRRGSASGREQKDVMHLAK